ncbi:MAG: hypothetical protein OQK75_12555 [Gammaproteobacteria bacterium]|nr:hypothetical protein [Gammaproteobacteria bacterium]MCW8988489.1 hypothetical protein [Gammaproteobacteria bacterium]MCW9031777.1 hypothetical protein [Gammaproteobacteria bacterium]
MNETNEISAALSGEERQEIAEKLSNYQIKLKSLPADTTDLERAMLQLEISELQLALDLKEESWNSARATFDTFIKNEQWQQAVEACNVMYQTEQPASIVALGHAVWLAVTYPIEADTSVAVLNHIVDETPADSDGAAVAAMVGYYIADIRSTDEQHDSMTFLAKTILGNVAKRHSNVQTQKEMDAWLFRLELNDPAVFLPRLSLVVNSIVEDNWWFDRDDLRSRLPVN